MPRVIVYNHWFDVIYDVPFVFGSTNYPYSIIRVLYSHFVDYCSLIRYWWIPNVSYSSMMDDVDETFYDFVPVHFVLPWIVMVVVSVVIVVIVLVIVVILVDVSSSIQMVPAVIVTIMG